MNRRPRGARVRCWSGVSGLMNISGISRWLVLAGLTSSAMVALADGIEISTEQWARPRSGEHIVALTSLQKMVRHLDERAAAVVIIRYAGGDEGLLWAEELRGWFVALGIPGDRLRLRAGLPDRDRLVLETE